LRDEESLRRKAAKDCKKEEMNETGLSVKRRVDVVEISTAPGLFVLLW
jgi:hypothetical protein